MIYLKQLNLTFLRMQVEITKQHLALISSKEHYICLLLYPRNCLACPYGSTEEAATKWNGIYWGLQTNAWPKMKPKSSCFLNLTCTACYPAVPDVSAFKCYLWNEDFGWFGFWFVFFFYYFVLGLFCLFFWGLFVCFGFFVVFLHSVVRQRKCF